MKTCWRCGQKSVATCPVCHRPICSRCFHPGANYCRSCHGLNSQSVAKKPERKRFFPKSEDPHDSAYWRQKYAEACKAKARCPVSGTHNFDAEIRKCLRLVEYHEAKERGLAPTATPWSLACVLQNKPLTEEGKRVAEKDEDSAEACPLCGSEYINTCAECGYVKEA